MEGHALDRSLHALIAEDYPRTRRVSIRRIDREDRSHDDLARIAREIGGRQGYLPGPDGEEVAWVETSWSPWALHAALVRMCAWSARVPDQRFEVRFARPLLRSEIWFLGTLQAGVFVSGNVPLAELDAWVSAHPRPRLAGHRVRATVTCWSYRSSLLRTNARSQVQPHEHVERVELPGGLAFAIQRADRIVPVLSYLMPGTPYATWTLELELHGDVAWRCRLTDDRSDYALVRLVRDLLRDVPATPEPDPPRAELVLPSAPALGGLARSEQLQLELQGDRRALAPDGSFAPIPVPARHVSADGRYRLQGHGHDAPRMQLTDALTGAVRDVRPAERGYVRMPEGFVGSELVMLQRGIWIDNGDRIVMYAPDGAERASLEFRRILVFTLDPGTAHAYVVAVRDVPLGSRRDDVPALVAINLHDFEETVLQDYPGAVKHAVPWDRDPHLFCHGGDLFSLHGDRETTLVRHAREAEVLARVGGKFDHAALDGAALTLVTADLDLPAGRCETFVHRLTLTGNLLGTVRLGLEPGERFAAAGPWLAWHGHDSGRIVLHEGLERRDEIAVPSGHRVSDLAISPQGALACVLSATDRDAALLLVARGGQHARIALPAPARVYWAAPG